MFMNSLYRSVSIYSRHHFILLPLCSPSTKRMSSRDSSSGDRRFPTPTKHATPLESFSLDEKDFPRLDGSKNKSDKSSGRTTADQSLTRRRNPIQIYVPPGRRSDTDQFIKEEANGPTVEVGVCTSSKREGDGSNPCKSSQFPNLTSGEDAALSSSQSNVECKSRDQSPIRRQDFHSETHTPVDRSNDSRGLTDRFTERGANVSSFGTGSKNKVNNSRRRRSTGCKKLDQSPIWRPVSPLQISASVGRRNDTHGNDPFIKEEADRATVELGNGTSSKYNKRKALRKSNLDRVSDNPFTPRKRWIVRNDGDSSKWNLEDDSYSKRSHRDTGFKNRVQTPKRRPFDICSSGDKKINTCGADRSIEEEEAGEKVTEQWSIEEEEADEKEAEHQTVEVVSNKHKVLRPGMVLLKHYLTQEVQVDIVRTCRKLGLKPNGFYQPGYKDGAKLRLQMMCLGRNWDPQTKYSNNNVETDPIPETFSVLVEQAIREAQAHTELPLMSPDICIVNFYTKTGRLGLHQDRDESRESITKGLPIVSFSIGDSAEFLYGEERDVEKAEQVKLESGDVLIFGGEDSRMIFHGVKSIILNSAPKCLVDESKLRRGRLNLTFRQY